MALSEANLLAATMRNGANVLGGVSVHSPPGSRRMLNLLVHDGLLIDGRGNPVFYGAVGMEGDHVHILQGDLSRVKASRLIDATGWIIYPGFITR